MAEQKRDQNTQGTFAQLYDVQEQLSRRSGKPLGRPPKKIQRKPTTIHLTQGEIRNLRRLHLQISEQLSINRSELVGVAIDALTALMDKKGFVEACSEASVEDAADFKQFVLDFLNS